MKNKIIPLGKIPILNDYIFVSIPYQVWQDLESLTLESNPINILIQVIHKICIKCMDMK